MKVRRILKVMKKWQRIIGLILIGLVSILLTWRLIAEYERYDITGSWNLDFNNTYLHSDSASLEFLNGWIIIHNDSIDLPPIYVPNNKIQHTLDLSKGTWSVDKKNNSITINAPNHPFHGKYFMKELRIKKERGHWSYFDYQTILMRLFYIDDIDSSWIHRKMIV